VFRGVSELTIDPKGRVAMPARYRDRLQEIAGGQIVITIDMDDPCLLLYPLPQWQMIEASIDALPSLHPATRRLQRLLVGHAAELSIDNQGRFLLPNLLRQHARLEKSAVLIGQGKKFEIWDEALWCSKREEWLALPADEQSLPNEMLSLSL
jgi:MraZ protein